MSDEKKNPETLPSQGYFGGGHGTRIGLERLHSLKCSKNKSAKLRVWSEQISPHVFPHVWGILSALFGILSALFESLKDQRKTAEALENKRE